MNANEKEPKTILITIKTTQGDWETEFQKTDKIQDVLTAVLEHFSFADGESLALYLESDPDNPLEVERTLVSYKIENGDILDLSDFGVGV